MAHICREILFHIQPNTMLSWQQQSPIHNNGNKWNKNEKINDIFSILMYLQDVERVVKSIKQTHTLMKLLQRVSLQC